MESDHSQMTTLRQALQALVHELYFKSSHFPGLKGHSPRTLHDADLARYLAASHDELLGRSDPFTGLLEARARLLPTGGDAERNAAIVDTWERAESTLNARLRTVFGFLGQQLPASILSMLTGEGALPAMQVSPGRNPIGGKRSDGLFGQPDLVLLGRDTAITIEMKVRGGTAKACYDVLQHYKYLRLGEALRHKLGITHTYHVLLAPLDVRGIVAKSDQWLARPVAHGASLTFDLTRFVAALPLKHQQQVLDGGGGAWLTTLSTNMPSRCVDLGRFLDEVDRMASQAGGWEPQLRQQVAALRRFGLIRREEPREAGEAHSVPDLRLSISGISERDLDLLLLEELLASPGFRQLVCESAGLYNAVIDSEPKARRSVTHSTGESDLELEIPLADGTVGVVLIENKVDASFQPLQAERYRQRGDGYATAGRCKVFRTLLVAPARYLGSDGSTMGFDGILSYESIDAWFVEQRDLGPRVLYKRALLRGAIEKSYTGYQVVADQQVTDFWDRYRKLVWELAPELVMPPSRGRPAGSTFIFFKPDGLSRSLLFVHKFTHGFVDLEFTGWASRLGELHSRLAGLLPPEASLVRAGKSAAMRWKVEPLGVARVDDVDAMRAAIQRVAAVLQWYREQAVQIDTRLRKPVG